MKMAFYSALTSLLIAPGAWAQSSNVEGRYYSAYLTEESISTEQALQVRVDSGNNCNIINLNDSKSDSVNMAFDVSIYVVPFDFGGCPYPRFSTFTIGRDIAPGDYKVNIYEGTGNNGDYFNAGMFAGALDLNVFPSNSPANAETPEGGSILSGVGIVRGWVCDASTVQVQFNNLPLLELAYGTTRADTLTVCGDEDNAYGAVFAWGLLGNGTHRARTFVDGVVIADVEFQVSGLSEPFVRNLEGAFELSDFPAVGESVTVQWSEADQNFIIVAYE